MNEHEEIANALRTHLAKVDRELHKRLLRIRRTKPLNLKIKKRLKL